MYDDWCCHLNGRGCFCNVDPTEGNFDCLQCGKSSGKELFCSNECYERFNEEVASQPSTTIEENCDFPPSL